MRGLLAVALALATCGGVARAPVSPPTTDSPSPSARITPAQFQITPTPPSATVPTSTPAPPVSPRPSSSGAAGALTYVAVGASDTVGVGATDPVTGSWPSQLAARLPKGSRYVNLGISGSLASGARTQQLPRVAAERPDVVTVWLAVNDLNVPVDPILYATNIASVVEPLILTTQAFIFVGNVPDLRSVPVYAGRDPNALLTRINAYNTALAALASRNLGRVFIVDLFTSSADIVSGVTVSGDGFHPSTAGYKQIAERFAIALRGRGLPVAP